MTAQVNLYQARFRKKHLKLSAARILALNGALIVAIVLLLGLDVWKLNTLRQQHAQLQHESAQMAQKWTQIQAQLVQLKSSDELELQVKKLETILAMRDSLLGFSRTGSFSNTQGYSDYLIALARQHKPGLWLTNITISEAGKHLDLAGQTNQAVLVPQYIQRLSTENIISGIPVHRFTMNRKDADTRHISFLIASRMENAS